MQMKSNKLADSVKYDFSLLQIIHKCGHTYGFLDFSAKLVARNMKIAASFLQVEILLVLYDQFHQQTTKDQLLHILCSYADTALEFVCNIRNICQIQIASSMRTLHINRVHRL